jgi:N-acetylmuramoyl-L-alanine amidase
MGIHRTQGNLDVAMAENSVILKEKDYSKEYEGFDVRSPEAYIIFSMLQNAYMEQSLNFAMKVQKQYKETLTRDDKGVKQAGFLVLWKSSMPSVLTEIGFLSNVEEMKYLMSNSGRSQIAFGIFSAFRL